MRPTPGTLDSIQRDKTIAGPITRAMEAEEDHDRDSCRDLDCPDEGCQERIQDALADMAAAREECGG